MYEDYRVNRRSDAQVRDIAIKTRLRHEQNNRCPVDIIHCLTSGWVHTEFGKKPLRLEIVDDHKMGQDDARTEYLDGVLVIFVRRSVHLQAVCGDGRGRMTLAHELGHAVMHPGAPKSRRVGAAGIVVDVSLLKPYESAEHQAKVFGSAFLINDDFAINFDGEHRISEEFGVSWEAAKIYCEQRTKKAEREASARRVEELNRQFQTSMELPQGKRYIPDPCTVCGQRTLSPSDGKYWCDTCRARRDPFADGDQLTG
jgi:hypothetical protein